MKHCPKGHGVRHLSVEPDVLVGRECPSKLGTNDANDVAQHRQENKAAIISQDEPSTTRGPHGKPKPVQGTELLVRFLDRVLNSY